MSYLRFVATRTRDPDAPGLQLAQFVAYGAQCGEPLVSNCWTSEGRTLTLTLTSEGRTLTLTLTLTKPNPNTP